jgi:signal transduction histidine kinase
VLADHGLADALKRLAMDSEMPLQLLEVPCVRVGATAELTAYFVVSEAVANAYKHAGAASITVAARTEADQLRLEIADDGRGGADEAAGSGLQGLRDRVEAVGGTLRVDSPRGRGTRIVVVIPV